MLEIQNFVKAESLEQAFELNQKKNNRIIGGMMWMRLGESRIQTAIDLSGLGLDKIEETAEEFRIGCMVTLRALEKSTSFCEYTEGCAKEALRHIVGVQFRNLATVGGSIYGRYGFSDVLTLFLALDSYAELYQGGLIPLSEYAKMQYDRDILVRMIVKKRPVRMAYRAVRITETDLPVLTCGAVKFTDTGQYLVCIGARPGRAIPVEDREGILLGELTEEKIKEFAGYVREHVPTRSNTRGSAEYRSHLAEVLVNRCLRRILETSVSEQ